MHVCGLNGSGSEVIQDRGGEVTDVILLFFGCSTAWNLGIGIASSIQAGLWGDAVN